jgi:glycosyltransferase involved in cell wall biosynthesis
LVLVHSQWAEGQVARDLPELPVTRVSLSVADPGSVDRAATRAALGLGSDEVVVMHLGYLTPEKGLGDLVGAVASVLRRGVRVRLLVVGEGASRTALEAAADALGMVHAVTFSGWLEPAELAHAPAAADVGVVLRSPSAGETSAAALRFLACGTPVAVTGNRQFLEWPEQAAPRITPGPSAMAELARLIPLAGSSASWAARRAAAREAYLAGHRPGQAAHEVVRALERFA